MTIIEKDGKIAHLNKPPIRPNMLVLGASAMNSTFARTDMSHSVLSENKHFNSCFHESNFEGCAFNSCDFDGSTFVACSFRGVELINCDIDHLMINGINIGNLLRITMGDSMGVK